MCAAFKRSIFVLPTILLGTLSLLYLGVLLPDLISSVISASLVLSAMNAFTEEAITRLSVITALDGILSRPVIYIISTLIFGIPHYFGVPGGILGSLMAGFLGWLLAKSIADLFYFPERPSPA